jgi:hypothetical protein
MPCTGQMLFLEASGSAGCVPEVVGLAVPTVGNPKCAHAGVFISITQMREAAEDLRGPKTMGYPAGYPRGTPGGYPRGVLPEYHKNFQRIPWDTPEVPQSVSGWCCVCCYMCGCLPEL